MVTGSYNPNMVHEWRYYPYICIINFHQTTK